MDDLARYAWLRSDFWRPGRVLGGHRHELQLSRGTLRGHVLAGLIGLALAAIVVWGLGW